MNIVEFAQRWLAGDPEVTSGRDVEVMHEMQMLWQGHPQHEEWCQSGLPAESVPGLLRPVRINVTISDIDGLYASASRRSAVWADTGEPYDGEFGEIEFSNLAQEALNRALAR